MESGKSGLTRRSLLKLFGVAAVEGAALATGVKRPPETTAQTITEVAPTPEELASWTRDRILENPTGFLHFVCRVLHQEKALTPEKASELQSFLDHFSPEFSQQPELATRNLEHLHKGFVESGLSSNTRNLLSLIENIGAPHLPDGTTLSNYRGLNTAFNGFSSSFIRPLYAITGSLYSDDSGRIRFPTYSPLPEKIRALEDFITWLEPMTTATSYPEQKHLYLERAQSQNHRLEENMERIWRYFIKSEQAEPGSTERTTQHKHLFETILDAITEFLPGSTAGFGVIDLTESHRAFYSSLHLTEHGSLFMDPSFYVFSDRYQEFLRNPDDVQAGTLARQSLNTLLITFLHELAHHLDPNHQPQSYSPIPPDMMHIHPADYLEYITTYARGLQEFYNFSANLPATDLEAVTLDPLALSPFPTDEVVDEKSLTSFKQNCDFITPIVEHLTTASDGPALIQATQFEDYFDPNRTTPMPIWEHFIDPDYPLNYELLKLVRNPQEYGIYLPPLDVNALTPAHLMAFATLTENVFYNQSLSFEVKRVLLSDLIVIKSHYQRLLFTLLLKASQQGLLANQHPLLEAYFNFQPSIAPHVAHSFNGPIASYHGSAGVTPHLAHSPDVMMSIILGEATQLRARHATSVTALNRLPLYTPGSVAMSESLYHTALEALHSRVKVWGNSSDNPLAVIPALENGLAEQLGLQRFPPTFSSAG